MTTVDRRIKRAAYQWRFIVTKHRLRIRVAQWLRKLVARIDP